MKKWILAGGLICAAITSLNAATIPVTSLADDGTAGTLRAALAAANDGDTIDATGVSGMITLLASELEITKSVTILGPGPANLTVSGNGTSRVFHIFSGRTVVIERLTIANGHAQNGGGIYNDHSELRLENCVVTENSATGSGGGIFTDGSLAGSAKLIIDDTLISANSAGSSGGGIFVDGRDNESASLKMAHCVVSDNSAALDGGGICNAGTPADIIECIFSGNSGRNGGALLNFGRFEATVTASTFTSNSATARGAGINNSGGTAAVVNSTFSGNVCDLWGGAINSEDGTLLIGNSTFTGNSAAELGGGLNVADNAVSTVVNCTFSGNSAGVHGGAIATTLLPGFTTSTLYIGSTILRGGGSAENIGGGETSTLPGFAIGTVVSLGFNLSSDDGGGLLTAGTDLKELDPKLGPLQDNGGPTFTHLPAPDSPAIDQGTSDTLLVFGITTDQRGSVRTVDYLDIANALLGDGTDIGAVELASPNGSPIAKTKDVTVLAGPGGTAFASIDDGSFDPDGDTITLVQDPPGPYPIGTTLVTLIVTDSNGASDSSTATVTVQGVADLLLSLGVDKTSVKQGDLLTYTITIKNFGPNEALNLVVNDIMSSGTTFVSAKANKGHFTAPPVNQTGTVTWSLANLLSGNAEGAQLVVKVLVKGKTTVTNSANVTADSSDPNSQNNSASITTTVGAGGGGNSGAGKKK